MSTTDYKNSTVKDYGATLIHFQAWSILDK